MTSDVKLGEYQGRTGTRRNWRATIRQDRRRPLSSVTLIVAVTLMLIEIPQSVRAVGPDGPDVCQSHVQITTSVTTYSTNATLGWSINLQSFVYIYWGNTSSYSFTAVNGVVYASGSWYISLNYLEPGTTYYYEVLAVKDPPSSGVCPGDSESQWTTGSDTMTEFQGIIEDVNNSVAPSNVWVQGNCAPYPPATTPGTTFAATGSTGTFSLTLPYGINSLSQHVACTGGYEVDVMNGYGPSYVAYSCRLPFIWNGGTNCGTGHFLYRWNETLFVYAPQWLPFIVPTAIQSWDPLVYEFDDNNSPFPQFNFTGSATVSSTDSTSYAGVTSSSSVSTTVSQSDGGSAGEGLEVTQRYATTGRLVFDALTNRTPWVTGLQYWGPETQSYTGAPLTSDWASVSQYGPSSCAAWGKWIERTYHHQDTMTISGSVSNTAGLQVDISLGVSIEGSGVGLSADVSLPFSYETTISSSSSASAIDSIYIPSTAPYAYYEFDVCFQGAGSTSSGIVIHVWQVGESNSPPP
jgi:hypothetical protein